MSKIIAAITAVGGYVPDYVLTNAELEKMVDTTDEWIMSRTGIKERRILKGEGMGTSDLGAPAVLQLCKKRGIDPSEIELLICATTTPDHQFPATANIITDKIGAKNAFGFDISAACSGFLYALVTGSKFIESGQYKKVVVVGADKMSSIVDYSDRSTCVIFGDGAGAVLLEPNTDGVGILDSILKSDGSGRVYLHQKGGGSVRPASHKSHVPADRVLFVPPGTPDNSLPMYRWDVRLSTERSPARDERGSNSNPRSNPSPPTPISRPPSASLSSLPGLRW